MRIFYILILGSLFCGILIGTAQTAKRYSTGVSSGIYTEPFDPCDPAYKFLQIRYGDPNNPHWQAAPDDWIQKFGNNERTCLIHAISELRVVVAAQGRRLLDIESKPNIDKKDPNEVK